MPFARGEGQAGSAVRIGFDKAVTASEHEIPLRSVDISASLTPRGCIAQRRRQRDDDDPEVAWQVDARRPGAGCRKPKGPWESSTL